MSGELDLKRTSPSSEREGVTFPQHHPSESRTTPACCAYPYWLSPSRGCSSPSVTVCGTFAQGKKGFETREKVTHCGHPEGRSGTWILLWHQLVSVRARPRHRAALSQFGWPKSWHRDCSEYPGDMLSFWHVSYLPDKHSCPQQRGIGCFWHWLLISHIQCKVFSYVFLQF